MQKSIYNVKLTRQVSGRYFSALTKVTFSISIYSIPACISGVQSELQCNGCTTGMIGASLSRTSLFGFFFSSKGEVFVLQCHQHINPNCKMWTIAVDGMPHLCLFAIRDIMPGEEVTYNYGDSDWPWRKQVWQPLTYRLVYNNEKNCN